MDREPRPVGECIMMPQPPRYEARKTANSVWSVFDTFVQEFIFGADTKYATEAIAHAGTLNRKYSEWMAS